MEDWFVLSGGCLRRLEIRSWCTNDDGNDADDLAVKFSVEKDEMLRVEIDDELLFGHRFANFALRKKWSSFCRLSSAFESAISCSIRAICMAFEKASHWS